MTGAASSWRLLRTWAVSPELAMGLDEVLLDQVGSPPTLRFYTWEPDTLSLGYFQRFAEVPATAQATRVVRRLTGGGAIHHAGELTFSIAADAAHPLYRGPVAPSYERVHAVVIDALGRHGVSAALRRADAVTSDVAGTGMCFHASTPLDIVWDEAKGVGSAQRRRRGRVLHHGSIKLAASHLETGVARAPQVSPADLADTLLAQMTEQWHGRFDEDDPTADELARAQVLGAATCAEAFLRRR
ncbi:MAG: hypothetical protein O2816_04690 [Planctomycetota bacterium]|nr:hypothetical protein [Planctomycetota bacterium]